MAWRSSGTTNDEMVDNLKRFGVISSAAVEQGFRNVDRRFFVPKNRRDVAHSDQPLKESNVHISAPHIYGSAVEALELVPQSCLSFLNVGSGTGYLSCIAADIMGPKSTHYGIEIFEDVVQHCKSAIAEWKEAHLNRPSPHIEIVHGNALLVSKTHGESVVGFDRIYVGASVERQQLQNLTFMLRPGGILVGPVDDELVKIVRIGPSPSASAASNDTTMSNTSSNNNNSNNNNDDHSSDFTQQVLSGVRFAPLLARPILPTVLPSKVWNPEEHRYYPDSFRHACKVLMLCSNAPFQQEPPPTKPFVNLASMLPRVVWMDILSYTHRDWFEHPPSSEEFLRRRLLEEQANAQRAHQARQEAEARCHLAERERDVYRLLARRWQARLESVLQQQQQGAGGTQPNQQQQQQQAIDDDTEDDEHFLLSGREQAVVFGLGAMLRTFQNVNDLNDDDDEDDDEDGDDDDDDNDDDEDDHHRRRRRVAMEEDIDDAAAAMMVVAADDDDGALRRVATSSTHHAMEEDDVTISSISSTLRPQARTVSISSEDL